MTTKGGGGAHDPERPQALPAKPASFDLATLVDQLVKLDLDFAAEALPAILTRAVKEDLGSPALLEQLLLGELERREERRVRTSLRLSGLPTGQTLANFDFAVQPAVQRSKLDALGTCAWLREKQVLLILGPPGVGKTHLAIALGVRAVESGFSVAFFRLEELLHAMRKDADMPPTRLKGKKYTEGGTAHINLNETTSEGSLRRLLRWEDCRGPGRRHPVRRRGPVEAWRFPSRPAPVSLDAAADHQVDQRTGQAADERCWVADWLPSPSFTATTATDLLGHSEP